MRDFASPRDQSFVWDYGREPFKISHHPAKYCHHRHCDSGDIMILACHVISQNRVIKGSCDFMGSILSRWATILPSLVVIDTFVVEI